LEGRNQELDGLEHHSGGADPTSITGLGGSMMDEQLAQTRTIEAFRRQVKTSNTNQEQRLQHSTMLPLSTYPTKTGGIISNTPFVSPFSTLSMEMRTRDIVTHRPRVHPRRGLALNRVNDQVGRADRVRVFQHSQAVGLSRLAGLIPGIPPTNEYSSLVRLRS